ncbi:MAG: hypothetical protein ACE5FO_14140, partial [Parvularculaceae bacterium]
ILNSTQINLPAPAGSGLDVHDHSVINRYIPDSERPVPFRNIVFVGDGDTDIPAFRLVKELGGIRLPFIRRVKEMGG